MNKSFFVVFSILTFALPSLAFAAVDPATIHGHHGGNVCRLDANGQPGRALQDGGYYNTGGAVAGVDPSIFPAGFFDNPTHYCYQETETWINLGVGLGGDTVNDYGWYYFNAPYSNDPGVSTLVPTAVAGKRNIKENWAFSVGPSTALAASLVANPTSILTGEQSMLSWSSTGAVSCVGTNFDTQGAVSGSVIVAPSQTTNYTVTCSTASGQTTSTSASTVINHSEADAYNSSAVIADMQAHGGLNLPAIQGNTAFSPDQASMDHVCVLIDGVGAVASNIGVRNYSSPGNNGVLSYAGGTWTRTAGVASHMSTSFTCTKPGTTTTTTTPGQSASASATVTVSSPAAPAFTVSCSPNPTQITVGDTVTWSSAVTGGAGTYTYAWTGTDGLAGTANQVIKKYTAAGHKSASLAVTYTPNSAPSQTAGPTTSSPTTPTTPAAVAPPQPLPGNVCPAIGWIMPVTPCAGTWAATYDTNNCQSGWQCVAPTGGGGLMVPLDTTPSLTSGLINLINNFVSPTPVTVPATQTVNSVNNALDNSVLGASCTPSVRSGQWYSSSEPGFVMASIGLSTSLDCGKLAEVQNYPYWNQTVEINIGLPQPIFTTCLGYNTVTGSFPKPSTGSGGSTIDYSSGSVCSGTAGSGNNCTLQFSPSSIQTGQSTTMSWTSSGVSSLSVDNGVGSVSPVAAGSKVITPSVSGTYTMTGSSPATQSTTAATVINHGEADAYNSSAVIADMQAHGGINLPAVQGNSAFSQDQASMDHVCVLIDGAGAVASNIGVRSYSSPGNNAVMSYNGTNWVRTPGVSLHMSTSFMCTRPGSTISTPGASALCQGALTVTGAPAPQSQTIIAECNGLVCTSGTCSCTGPNCGGVEVTKTECSDGVDNADPEDTKVDMADPGCSSPQDDDETDAPKSQCSDGKDNDADGKKDYPADPGCTSSQDDDETDTPQQCTDANFCKLNDVYHRDAQCTETFVKSCPVSCVNGECVAGPGTGGAGGGLTLTPGASIVGNGKTTVITWGAIDFVANSCTLVGSNGDSWVLTGTQGSVTTRPLSVSAEYTLTCTDASGHRVSKKVTVKVAPKFEEI